MLDVDPAKLTSKLRRRRKRDVGVDQPAAPLAGHCLPKRLLGEVCQRLVNWTRYELTQ